MATNRHGSDTADAVRLTDVHKVFGRSGNQVAALDGVTTAFARGSFTAIMGPSGSGKSTLLQCAAGLDQPTTGSVLLDGYELSEMDETELTMLRRDRIGFVFQAFNLLPVLTVRQNVTLPLRLAGRKPVAVGSPRCSSRSGSAIGADTARPSSPAASSSAWPSPAP